MGSGVEGEENEGRSWKNVARHVTEHQKDGKEGDPAAARLTSHSSFIKREQGASLKNG